MTFQNELSLPGNGFGFCFLLIAVVSSVCMSVRPPVCVCVCANHELVGEITYRLLNQEPPNLKEGPFECWCFGWLSILSKHDLWIKQHHMRMIERNESDVDEIIYIRTYLFSRVCNCLYTGMPLITKRYLDVSYIIFCHVFNFNWFAKLYQNGSVRRLSINIAIWWVTLPPITIVSVLHFAEITGIIV